MTSKFRPLFDRDRHHEFRQRIQLRCFLRRRLSGGYFQWVLDTVCEMVEWSYQPLGFESLALRLPLGLMNCSVRADLC